MDSATTSSDMSSAKTQKPVFSSDNLYPTTSTDTGRYDKTDKVQTKTAMVNAAMFLASRDQSPSYLPPRWNSFVHPEGATYFYRDSFPPVVTEAYLYHPEVATKISLWADLISQKLAEKGIELTEDVELFLQVENDQCFYYFVDHSTRTLFWMDKYETEDLNILPVMSSSHLKLALEDKYWNHVQTFPMHFGGLSLKTVDNLIGVFIHATADHMTSSSSTFPYDAEKCMKFVKLLKLSRDHIQDGSTTCFVARLWCIVVNNRFWTHYGEEHVRLSRDQSILASNDHEITWTATVLSAVSLGASDSYRSRLNNIYVDQYVYEHQWHAFMSYCFTSWTRSSKFAVYVLILHLSAFFVPFLPVLTALSGSLLTASLVVSTWLIHNHDQLENGTASDAHTYLSSVYSPKFKFQCVSMVYCLPKALSIWGLLVFFSQWVVIATSQLGFIFATGLVSIILICSLVLRSTPVILFRNTFALPSSISRIFSPLKATRIILDSKDEESMV